MSTHTAHNILFADAFPEDRADTLRDLGHQCSMQPDLGADELPAALGEHDILVVRSTRVSAAAIAAGAALKMIIRAGAGTNTIDKDAAAARGVYVCNVPGKNAVAVAELAMGLILAIDRRIPDNVADLRAGRWNKKRYAAAAGLYGKTLGIVGVGAIGLALAERARAFGMPIVVVRKAGRSAQTEQTLEALGAAYAGSIEELAGRCDFVSLHVPQSDATRGLVNDALLAHFKPGAVLINTSRGDVIDEDALLRAIEQKDLRAGLDVYQGEPGSSQDEFVSGLAQHPAVYGTHHIGASTAQAQGAVSDGVIEIVTAFAAGEVLHCVNKEQMNGA